VRQLERWRQRAAQLKQEVYALALACKHPRVPWHAKLLALCIVAYALSPIDLIPDFIPVLGYLDDLILVPLGIYFLLRLIPPEVLAECREKARLAATTNTAVRWLAAGVIIAIWIVLAIWAIRFMLRILVA
jgi:uncharacterized membrane protein YkvA (DUF1232 family)